MECAFTDGGALGVSDSGAVLAVYADCARPRRGCPQERRGGDARTLRESGELLWPVFCCGSYGWWAHVHTCVPLHSVNSVVGLPGEAGGGNAGAPSTLGQTRIGTRTFGWQR